MQPATVRRRLLALVIDWLVAILSAAALTGSAFSGDGATGPFVNLGVFFLYVWLTTGLVGSTIGKRVLGLGVQGPDGRPIGLVRGAVRTALLCLVVPALITNDDARGLHDIAAGSRVVRRLPGEVG